jgi:hypothetical protein
MDTVEILCAGLAHLKRSGERKVLVEEQSVVIEPAGPAVAYVPIYNQTIS